MATDLMLHIPHDGKSFTINLVFLADDGYLYAARRKTFEETFIAKKLDDYVKDWQAWDILSAEDLNELRKIRKGMKPTNGEKK